MSLKPGQHKLEDLARVAVKNSKNRGNSLTSMQKEALKEAGKSIPANNVSTRDIILFYEPIFDKLFFFGSLKGRLNITASGKWTFSEGNYGWTAPKTRRPDMAKIVINTLAPGTQKRVLDHMGTLIHEMIHAFILIYALPQYTYNMAYQNFANDGYTGHGVAWHDIAYALEKAVTDPTLWGVKLWLGRDNSMQAELRAAQQTGERIDPSRWGLGHLGGNARQPSNHPDSGFFCSRIPSTGSRWISSFGGTSFGGSSVAGPSTRKGASSVKGGAVLKRVR